MYEGLAEHLLLWLKDAWAPPFRIHIFTTDRCNLRCPSCWRWGVDPEGQVPYNPEELSDTRLLSIVSEAAELGVREIELCGGGEPLLRKDIALAMMAKIKALGMRGSITTNGTLLTEEFARKLVGIGWDHIIISLDGPSPEINDALRPPAGTFQKVMKAIGWINEAKRLAGRGTPYMQIQCVLSKVNVRHIEAMVKLTLDNNLQSIIFDPLVVFSEKGRDLALSGDADQKALDEEIEKAVELLKQGRIDTNLYSLRKAEKDADTSCVLLDGLVNVPLCAVSCFEPWYRMYIHNLGQTSYCCFADYSAKDNVKEKSLRDIWLGEHFASFRRALLENKIPDFCLRCNTCMSSQTKRIKSELKALLGDKASQPGAGQ